MDLHSFRALKYESCFMSKFFQRNRQNRSGFHFLTLSF